MKWVWDRKQEAGSWDGQLKRKISYSFTLQLITSCFYLLLIKLLSISTNKVLSAATGQEETMAKGFT